MNTFPMTRLLLSIAVVAGALAIAACGGTSYGSSPLNGSTGGQAALGNSTPTPDATAPPQATSQAATQTAPPARTPAPTPQAAAFAIGINGDNSGQPQFNPPAARVYVGTVITFTNHDSVARSVVADSGGFDSGPIAPGGSWKYTASMAGTFNYHDGTRPYAVAYFQVVSQ